MPEKPEPWDLVIGRVAAPFGIIGEVRVKPETDFPDRFGELREVCLSLPSGEDRVCVVESARPAPRGILMRLAGCRDRAAAEALRGALLKIRASMAVPLPAGSYWIHEIIGMRVLTETGEDLGEVGEVLQGAGHDIYVTPKAMIPAVREIVKRIDRDRREMIVALPADDEGEL